MSIRYIDPLGRAIERSREILFRPFDLGKWFVLGFGCWLARLAEGGGGGGFSPPMPPIGDREAEGTTLQGPLEALENLDPEAIFGGAFIAVLIGCFVLLLFVLLPLLLWLSSRGQFIFLDGVVRNEAEIKAPWAEYKTEGNSLFLWRLGFVGVIILGALVTASPLIIYIVRFGEEVPSALMVLLLACPIALFALGAAYVDLFLRSFVVPIMYRERLKTNAAWRRFGPYLKQRLGSFLLYGLWLVVLTVGVVLGVLILVLVTCCIAGILLIIPYIGTVLMLPVYVAFRALSLEFLAQFSDDFRFFPEPGPEPEPLSAAAAG